MQNYKSRGLTVSMEGPDGAGKSTACKYLVELLKTKDFDIHHTREPGGTVIAEEIRNLILTKRKDEEISSMTELLLFAAARAQHIEKVIKPEMEKGKIVVIDRFSDSTFAYQGYGRSLISEVSVLEDLVHKGFEPDYTLFFHVTLDESIKRLNARNEDNNRLDDESLIFKSRVHQGYTERFKQFKHRMVFIDAMQDIEGVNKQVKNWVETVLVQRRKSNEKRY